MRLSPTRQRIFLPLSLNGIIVDPAATIAEIDLHTVSTEWHDQWRGPATIWPVIQSRLTHFSMSFCHDSTWISAKGVLDWNISFQICSNDIVRYECLCEPWRAQFNMKIWVRNYAPKQLGIISYSTSSTFVPPSLSNLPCMIIDKIMRSPCRTHCPSVCIGVLDPRRVPADVRESRLFRVRLLLSCTVQQVTVMWEVNEYFHICLTAIWYSTSIVKNQVVTPCSNLNLLACTVHTSGYAMKFRWQRNLLEMKLALLFWRATKPWLDKDLTTNQKSLSPTRRDGRNGFDDGSAGQRFENRKV
jgi:hypothetical protein